METRSAKKRREEAVGHSSRKRTGTGTCPLGAEIRMNLELRTSERLRKKGTQVAVGNITGTDTCERGGFSLLGNSSSDSLQEDKVTVLDLGEIPSGTGSQEKGVNCEDVLDQMPRELHLAAGIANGEVNGEAAEEENIAKVIERREVDLTDEAEASQEATAKGQLSESDVGALSEMGNSPGSTGTQDKVTRCGHPEEDIGMQEMADPTDAAEEGNDIAHAESVTKEALIGLKEEGEDTNRIITTAVPEVANVGLKEEEGTGRIITTAVPEVANVGLKEEEEGTGRIITIAIPEVANVAQGTSTLLVTCRFKDATADRTPLFTRRFKDATADRTPLFTRRFKDATADRTPLFTRHFKTATAAKKTPLFTRHYFKNETSPVENPGDLSDNLPWQTPCFSGPSYVSPEVEYGPSGDACVDGGNWAPWTHPGTSRAPPQPDWAAFQTGGACALLHTEQSAQSTDTQNGVWSQRFDEDTSIEESNDEFYMEPITETIDVLTEDELLDSNDVGFEPNDGFYETIDELLDNNDVGFEEDMPIEEPNDESYVEPRIETINVLTEDEILDNNGAGWDSLRNLRTDPERFVALRLRWGNPEVPNPRGNLTCHNFRNKRLAAQGTRKRAASPSLEEPAGKRLCTVVDERIADLRRENRDKEERLRQEYNSLFQDLVVKKDAEFAVASAHGMQLSNSYFAGVQSKYQVQEWKIQDRFLKDMQNLRSKQSLAIKGLNSAKQEMEAFYKFYEISDGPVALTPEEVDRLAEQERMFSMYDHLYSG